MWSAIATMILSLLVFTAIGLGPAVWLLGRRNRIETALAAAPVVGFALSALASTYLILLDLPVSTWARSFAGIAIGVSLVLILLRRKALRQEARETDRRSLGFYAAGMGITLVLLAGPLVSGGLRYTVLRGNPWDACNYVMVANCLDREKYSWASTADEKQLWERSHVYGAPTGPGGYQSRWATMALLALTADWAGVNIESFEFAFSLLCVALMFGPGYMLARLGDLRPAYALLVGVAACVGFGGYFAVEIRAQGQITALPVALLIAMTFARTGEEEGFPFHGELILAGIATAALTLLYVEMMPFLQLGLVMYLGLRFLRQRRWRWAVEYLTPLAVAAVLAAPMWRQLGRFLASQMNVASANAVAWHYAYFPWLYDGLIQAPGQVANETPSLAGLWGLSWLKYPAFLGGVLPEDPLGTVLMLIGGLMTVVLIVAVVAAFVRKAISPAARLTACLALAGYMQFAYLFAKGQYWAAGKGFSFGHPFYLLAPALLVLAMVGTQAAGGSAAPPPEAWRRRRPPPGQPKPKTGRNLTATLGLAAVGLVLGWLGLQWLCGLWRIPHAADNRNPDGYINHGPVPEYRLFDWNPAPIRDALRENGQQTVCVFARPISTSGQWFGMPGTAWESEYWLYALCDIANVRNADLPREMKTPPQPLNPFSPQHDYLVIHASLLSRAPELKPGLVAGNDDFLLIRLKGLPLPGSAQSAR